MSSNNVSHKLSVVIGAALSSGFNSTISGSASKIGQIGAAIKDMEKQSTLSARTLDNLKTRYNSFLGSLNKQQAILQKRSFYRSQILDMVALGTALVAPINAARKFNSHLSKLKRIFNFSDSDGHKKFGAVLTEMSLRLPVTIDDLGKLSVMGGRFGVALEELPRYVEDVAKASKVWGMEAEEAGEKVGNFMKTFGIKAPDVSKYFDVITRLGRDTGKTADEVLKAVVKAGDGLANFKLSLPQVAALTSTIMSFGEGSEQAGTLVTGMLQKLSIAPKLGANAQKALRSVGLSAKIIPHMLENDPQKVLDKLFDGMSKLSVAQRGIALYQIFGRGPSKMVGKLISNLNVYRENLHKAQEENSAGYFEKDWESIAKGTSSGITLLTNSLSSFGLQIGMALLPTIKKLCHGLSEVLQPIMNFMNENKELTSTIIHAVAGFISLRIATFALGYASTFLFGGLNKLVIVFKGLRLGLALLGAGFKTLVFGSIGKLISALWFLIGGFLKLAFGAIGKLIPILWSLSSSFLSLAVGAIGQLISALGFLSRAFLNLAVGAIGKLITAFPALGVAFRSFLMVGGPLALIGAAYLLISNWEKVRAFFSNIWDKATTHWLNFKSIASGFGTAVTDNVVSSWTSVRDFFTTIWNEATTHWNSFIEKIQSLNIADKIMASWMKLKTFFTGIWNDVTPSFVNFTAPLAKIWDGAKSSISSVGNLFKSDDRKSSLSSKLPSLKNNAPANVNKNQSNNFHITVNAMKARDAEEVAKLVTNKIKNYSGAFLYDAVPEAL